MGGFFGDWCGPFLRESGHLNLIEAAIPVSLLPKRRKTLCCDQEESFARTLALNLGAEYCDDRSIKVKNTKIQTKDSKEMRWENPKDAFSTYDAPRKYKIVLFGRCWYPLRADHGILCPGTFPTIGSVDVCIVYGLGERGLKFINALSQFSN